MTTYRDVVLADGPAYYWGLDDALGSATYASVVSGGPTLAPSGSILLQQPGLALADTRTCAKFNNGASALSSQAAPAPNVFALECLISTTKTSCYLLGHVAGTSYDRHLYIGSSGRLILGVYDSANRVVIGSSVVSDGKTHHVVGRVAAGGVLSVWVDGVKQGEATFGPTFFAYSPKISVGLSGFNMSGWPEASADLMPFVGFMDEPAVYRGALSDPAIVHHAQVALRPSRLAGRATLDNGSPASLVLARNWDTDETVGSATPEADGSWQIYVAPGKYEVSVRGPAGYQPITHGPVVAVSDV